MGPTVASTEAEVKSTVEGNAAAIWWVLVKARQRTADNRSFAKTAAETLLWKDCCENAVVEGLLRKGSCGKAPVEQVLWKDCCVRATP